MIKLRRCAAILASHPRRKQCDPKSKFSQQSRERAIQFVAKTAAPQIDDLAEEAFLIAADLAPERYIQILERNGVEMSEMQAPERFRVRSAQNQ